MKVVRDGDFVGVVGPDRARGRGQALAAIKAEWKTTPQPSAKDLFEHLKEHAAGGGAAAASAAAGGGGRARSTPG